MPDDIVNDRSSADAVARVRAIFSVAARVQRMLDVEVALAQAQASLGLVPASAADTIAAAAHADRFELATLEIEARQAGNLAIPLVKHLTALVAREDSAAARFVHWGATSQDIIDTGLILQLREALPIVLTDLHRAADAAATHARLHVATTMAGRTWLQQATPVTFGLKAAGWLDALARITAGLRTATNAALVLQFGGASGTLAALDTRGLDVSTRLGALLALPVPAVPWHAHRDRLATLACSLGVVCGTAGKIARDLSLLAQTEVSEVSEGAPGGSSTMPHKRNPVQASHALAAAIRAPGLVATMLSAMPQEHERGLDGWQAEWETLPELIVVTASAAAASAEALEHLTVDPDAMRNNLQVTRGLVMAEAVMMRLAPHLGKSAAHTLVDRAARRSIAERREFADALIDDPQVTHWLDANAIRAALDPEQYLGVAAKLVERVLAERRRAVDADPLGLVPKNPGNS